MYKGVIFNIICSLLFVISGYLVHFVLGSSMTAAQYGVIGAIITILDFEYLFLNNGVRQSLSKEISKNKYNIKDLIVKGIVFQLILIAIMFSINFFGAGVFADILNDGNLSIYLKYAALLIPFNGLYVITMGVNEGFHHFTSSASIGIVYSIFKLSVIPFVLFIFTDKILGTEMGFLCGIICALITGIITLIINKKDFNNYYEEKLDMSSYVKNTLNFSAFFIIVSVVLSVDTLIVKAIESDGSMAGYYTGGINFAKVSYFILSAFFTIILPIVTRYYTENNMEEARKTIRNMFMIIFAFVMPITVVISASSSDLLASFYKPEYVRAGNTLMILAFSHFFMGLVVMFNMIITATNKRKFSSILATIMVIADVSLCIIMTKLFGIVGTAIAGVTCTFVAMIISGRYMMKIFDNVITKNHIKAIIFNVVLWIILKVLFSYIAVGNIIKLGLIYIAIYLLALGSLQLLKIINIKELIKIVMKK